MAYQVVRHCKHAVPIGPCGFCCLAFGQHDLSQPRVVASFDHPTDAEWSAASRRGREERFSPRTFSVIEV